MRNYWLDTLSVIAESLNNAIKLERTVMQNFSKNTIIHEKDPENDAIFKNFELKEEQKFYEHLRDLKIISPIKETVKRQVYSQEKVSGPTCFYRQILVEDKSKRFRQIWSPKPEIKRGIFSVDLENKITEKSKLRKKNLEETRKLLKSSTVSSFGIRSESKLSFSSRLSILPPNFMYKSPQRSHNFHKVLFTKGGKKLVKIAVRNHSRLRSDQNSIQSFDDFTNLPQFDTIMSSTGFKTSWN